MIVRGHALRTIVYADWREYAFWRPVHLLRRALCVFGWHDGGWCTWCGVKS